ncbi:MAG: ribosomal subunit interface protein [Planctomycetes bacterium HGW-Planctomycetes-1]|nr:MAG: ribosomal subunit interface protein [Planctomycetes bacterium HGW-Planctomycetes-1]
MDIRITGKHTEMTEDIKARIEEKVSGFPRFYSSVLDAEVIIEGGKTGAANIAEIIVRAKHNRVFIGKHSDPDVYVCIDQAAEKVERQLTKQKQKERDNKHSGGEVKTQE